MSTGGLSKITIESLRGSVKPFTLAFEQGKRLTVVYGENGTGKSTICDAFEFIGRGRVGSLEDRGLGKTERYWASLGAAGSKIAVTLEFNDKSTCRATLARTGVLTSPVESRPLVEVLRRSQLCGLIEAQPAERYAAIARFIDVGGVETCETSLRFLIKDLNGRRETAITRISENREEIRRLWIAAGSPGTDSNDWARSESLLTSAAWDAEIEAIGKLQAAYTRLVRHVEGVNRAEMMAATAVASELTAQADLEKLLASAAQGAGELVDVLRAAGKYLRAEPKATSCPVCESSSGMSDLATRIESRIEAFATLKRAQDDLLSATRNATRAKDSVETMRNETTSLISELDRTLKGFKWSETSTAIPASPIDSDSLSQWLTQTATLPAQWKVIEKALLSRVNGLRTLKSAFDAYSQNLSLQAELESTLPRLNRALELVEEERKNHTSGVLSSIATEVGRIYEAVHPGEGLDRIGLQLDPTRRASLELEATFCGKAGAPPQAYFSESHLDTLGLCIFIALAGMEDPASKVLVLDDVLASVDEPHVERLIEMLYTETQKFRHCVITTHYRPWKLKFQWGWLRHGACQFIELHKWTLAGGLKVFRTSVPEVDRLKNLLDADEPDIQSVCSKAGVLLEAALDFLTQLYECKVPRRKDGLYTLGDLLPAIDKKLANALKVEVLTIGNNGTSTYITHELKTMLAELTRVAQTRNVLGAHFSTLSGELLDSDAVYFGKTVYTLVSTLACPKEGWPRSGKSGQYWATSGQSRRLHPLKQPS